MKKKDYKKPTMVEVKLGGETLLAGSMQPKSVTVSNDPWNEDFDEQDL